MLNILMLEITLQSEWTNLSNFFGHFSEDDYGSLRQFLHMDLITLACGPKFRSNSSLETRSRARMHA